MEISPQLCSCKTEDAEVAKGLLDLMSSKRYVVRHSKGIRNLLCATHDGIEDSGIGCGRSPRSALRAVAAESRLATLRLRNGIA